MQRREREAVAVRAHDLWDPGYDGGFWTERHAGFGLLAQEWAAEISSGPYAGWADEAVATAD